MITQRDLVVHLSTISGVGATTIQNCIQQMRQLGLPLVDLYNYTAQELISLQIVPRAKADLVVGGLQDRTAFDQLLQDVERGRAGYVTMIDDEYPKLLKNINGAPAVLFYQGDLAVLDKKTIAFVGARRAHGYSRFMAERLIKPLVEQDWTIVSGGALGADSYAHEATLACGGRTVAVLGSGLLHWAPGQHLKLFQSIIDSGGLLVSSFAMDVKPYPAHFPVRNRIIAGLSQGCVVLQAGRKSGALITAQYALDQGREVFAVPGLVNDELSVGPHRLIQQGAKLVADAADIVCEFDVHHTFVQKNLFEDLDKNTVAEPAGEYDSLLCYLVKPMTTDDLLIKTGLSLDELQDKLFQLSLAGVLEQDFAGAWRRI
jgi:DNA processing protein